MGAAKELIAYAIYPDDKELKLAVENYVKANYFEDF